MELMKLMKQAEFPVPTNCILYPCGDRVVIFRKLSTIKPMDKLAEFGNDWDEVVILSRFKKLAESLEDEFHVNYGCT